MIRNVKVISDTATPALREQMEKLKPSRLQRLVGPACRELTETHMASLGTNKRGWPSSGFYEKFARNVRWLPDQQGVAVVILPAMVNGREVSFKQRYYGGPITPQIAQALAIPISPVSYGKVPSDFRGLFLMKTSKGAYLVQSGTEISGKTGRVIQRNRKGLGGHNGRRQRATLNFLFKLSGGVNQKGDKSTLPRDEQYTATAALAVLKNI
jgi:hypothetical protein